MSKPFTVDLEKMSRDTLKALYWEYAQKYFPMVDEFGEDSKEVQELREKFMAPNEVYYERYGEDIER